MVTMVVADIRVLADNDVLVEGEQTEMSLPAIACGGMMFIVTVTSDDEVPQLLLMVHLKP